MGSPGGFLGGMLTRMVRPGGGAASAGLLTFAQVSTAGLGFVTNVVGARVLGAGDFGVAALVMAFPTLVWAFAAVKPMAVTTRYLAVFRDHGQVEEFGALSKVGYAIDAGSALAALGIVAALGGWVVTHVQHLAVAPSLLVLFTATFVPQALTGTASSVLTALERFPRLAAGLLAGGIVKLVAVLALLWMGLGVWGFVIGLGIGQAVAGLALFALATRAAARAGMGGWLSSRAAAVRPLRSELTGLFSWNYLMATLGGIVTQVPLMLLGRIRSGEEAGFFRLATVLATVAEYPAQAAGRVVLPQLSRLHGAASEPAGLLGRLRRWSLQGGVPMALLIGVGMLLLPVAVPLLFGQAFAPMVPGLQLILVGSAAASLLFWIAPLYYAKVEVARWTRCYLVYTAVAVALSWAVMGAGGFVAVAAVVGLGRVVLLAVLVLRDPSGRGVLTWGAIR